MFEFKSDKKKMDLFEINIQTLNVFKTIDSHLDFKINQLETETLFLEKILFQELPKKKISKYQKFNSLKNVFDIPEENIAKYDNTIVETLEKAKNLFENIKNEKIESKIPKRPMILEKNLKKIPEKPKASFAVSRKFSVENHRNKEKTKENLTKKKTNETFEKKEVSKITEEISKKKEEVSKKIEEVSKKPGESSKKLEEVSKKTLENNSQENAKKLIFFCFIQKTCNRNFRFKKKAYKSISKYAKL